MPRDTRQIQKGTDEKKHKQDGKGNTEHVKKDKEEIHAKTSKKNQGQG